MSFVCVPPAAHWIWSYLDAQRTSNKTCQLLSTLIVLENSSSSSHAGCSGWSGHLPFAQSTNLDFILNILPQTSLSSVHSISYIFSNPFLNIHSDMILLDHHQKNACMSLPAFRFIFVSFKTCLPPLVSSNPLFAFQQGNSSENEIW